MVAVSIMFCVILFLLEMIVASKDLGYYLSRLYNYFDFYQYITIPILLILNYQNKLNHTEQFTNAFLVFTILISTIRSVTLLRVIDGVRYLIDMIFQVFSDMKYFGIVLVSSVGMFAVIEVQTMKLEPDQNQDFHFFKSMDYIYNIAFGQWDETRDYNPNRYLVFILYTSFLTLVMLNLLIAIISKTFEKF